MKRLLSLLSFLVAGLVWAADPPHSYVPPQGLVPTSEVAIRIAVAVWEPIYGASNIERQKPYQATLKDGIWYVQGSLPPVLLGAWPLQKSLNAMLEFYMSGMESKSRSLNAEVQHRPVKKSPNMAVKTDCGKSVAGFLNPPRAAAAYL